MGIKSTHGYKKSTQCPWVFGSFKVIGIFYLQSIEHATYYSQAVYEN